MQWLTLGENFGTARRDGREAVLGASARSHTITGLSEYGFLPGAGAGSERRGRERGV